MVDIDDATHQAIAGLKEEMNERMAGLTSRKLRLALLAELVDEFLMRSSRRKRRLPKNPRRGR